MKLIVTRTVGSEKMLNCGIEGVDSCTDLKATNSNKDGGREAFGYFYLNRHFSLEP